MTDEWHKKTLNEKLSGVLQTGQTAREASLDILAQTFSRISSIDNWCQEHDARTAKGRAVPPDHEDACQWCLGGSLTLSIWDYADRCKADAVIDRHKDIGLAKTESDRVGATLMSAFSIVLNRDDYALVRVLPEYNFLHPSHSFAAVLPLIAKVNDNYGHSTALMLLRDVIKYIETET